MLEPTNSWAPMILIDENLPPGMVQTFRKLTQAMNTECLNIVHVHELGFSGKPDEELHTFLLDYPNPIIVTGDKDFLSENLSTNLRVIYLYDRSGQGIHKIDNLKEQMIYAVGRNASLICEFLDKQSLNKSQKILALPIGDRAPYVWRRASGQSRKQRLTDPIHLWEHDNHFARRMRSAGWNHIIPYSFRSPFSPSAT